MLEQLRRQSGSFIIWFIFAIIILAFVFTFGSQGGLQVGCGGASDTDVMTVDGTEVDLNSFRYGLNTLRGHSRPELAQQVLDQLVVREILAQAAEASGYSVSQDLANEYIKRGEFWVLGNPQNGQGLFVEQRFEGGDPSRPIWVLRYDRLESLVNSWGLASVELFIQEQQRELMADMVRSTMIHGAVASPEEARAHYAQENTTATIDALVLRTFEYRSRLTLTRADIDAYLAAHDAEVKTKYDENERLYKDKPPEARLRMIMFQRQQQAGPLEGEGEGEAPPVADAAREAAESARARLVAGADFAELARELSQDEFSRASGGDMGWRQIDSPGLGATELGAALARLDEGAVSEVIETPRGYYILKVEGKREGDLTYDQVKHEIAEGMAQDYYAREAARRDAQAALDSARTSGKKLDELYERQAPPPQFSPQQLPAELLEQLSPEELMNLLQQGREQGSITIESRDIPAESMWQGGAVAGTADQPALPRPAAGSAVDATVASGEVIPRPADMPAPKVRRIGPFQRDPGGQIAEIGESKELLALIFDTLRAGELAPQVYEVNDSFVVVQVLERQNPAWDKFDEAEQARVLRSLAMERGYGMYGTWIERRCRELATAGKIRINQELLNQIVSDDSEKAPFQYQACGTVRY
jgi:peptidyl-prolyl cis-trans isomerase D